MDLLTLLMDNYGNVSAVKPGAEKLDTLRGIGLYKGIIDNKGDVAQVQDLFGRLAYDTKLNLTDLLMGAGDIAFSRRGAELLAQGYDMKKVAEVLAIRKSLGKTFLETILNPIGAIDKAFNDSPALSYDAKDDAVIIYATSVKLARDYLEAKSAKGQVTVQDMVMVAGILYEKGAKEILATEKKDFRINYGGGQ